MIRLLDKERELGLLPQLFDLFYENMSVIAPEDRPYEEQKREWLSCIGEALTREPRQILLFYAGKTLAGFCMYYIRGDMLMIEELQIRAAYQKTVLAAELYRFVRRNLLAKVNWIEAYAHGTNAASQRLMKKLGMEQVGCDGGFLHFRGKTEKI